VEEGEGARRHARVAVVFAGDPGIRLRRLGTRGHGPLCLPARAEGPAAAAGAPGPRQAAPQPDLLAGWALPGLHQRPPGSPAGGSRTGRHPGQGRRPATAAAPGALSPPARRDSDPVAGKSRVMGRSTMIGRLLGIWLIRRSPANRSLTPSLRR